MRRSVLAVAAVLLVCACGAPQPDRADVTETAATSTPASTTSDPVATTSAGETPGARTDEPWRGLLLGAGPSEQPSAVSGAAAALPGTAPGYRWRPPTVDDLRALADRHAGRPVEAQIMSGGDPELQSFETGDGWFMLPPHGAASPSAVTWTWIDAAFRTDPSGVDYETLATCPAGTPVPVEALTFFTELGLEVAPDGQLECTGTAVRVRLESRVDGLPVVGVRGSAMVLDGRVVDASMPLLTLEPLGELELAPAAEVVRRLAYGPGVVPSDPACEGTCAYDAAGAELVLGVVSSGGEGPHDHTVGHSVPGPDEPLLVPALRVMTSTATSRNLGVPSRSAVALSSALLVDDAADAALARQADEVAGAAAAAGGPSGCAGTAVPLAVCSSAFEGAAGDPVVLVSAGEVNDPVGASGCSPVLTLDAGDGTVRTAPLPRSGTLVSSRMVHVYEEPGTYTVTAHRASRCTSPASPGGSEPEYDETVQLRVLVR